MVGFFDYGGISRIVGGAPTIIVASRHSGPVPSSHVILYVVVTVSAGVGSDPPEGGLPNADESVHEELPPVIVHCPSEYPDVTNESAAVPPEKMTGGVPPNEMIFPEIVTEFEHAVS